MDTQKGFSRPELPVEDILSQIETCTLCGTRLRFSHQTDFLQLQVHENAKCPGCGIQKQTALFILQ